VKRVLVSFAFLVLASGAADAQLGSSPLDPGLYDYLLINSEARVAAVGERTLVVSGIKAELVGPEQITISAVIADLRQLSPAEREAAERAIDDYNVNGAVGTLTATAGTLRLVHHFNPEIAMPMQIADAIEVFRKTVDEQRANFARRLAAR
jgi:hypothetical protein